MGDLDRHLFDLAKPREWQYGEDLTTNQSDVSRVEEVIREKLFERLNKELPYSITQENIGWTNLSDGALRIDQRLIVDSQSQACVELLFRVFLICAQIQCHGLF